MGLSNLFKRKPADDARAGSARPAAVDPVEKVRTRTRQRLIGAVVLLTIGVIGFPLLFESQPRPIPVDIPIVIPRQEAASPLVLPAPPVTAAPSVEPPAAPEAASAVAPTQEVAMPAETASAAVVPEVIPVPAPAAAALPPEPTPSASAAADRPAAAAASAADSPVRFVVQVGAFVDPEAAREVRQKVEKLGMKTYAQVAQTNAGKRTRVRIGPFATRAEADKVLARARDAGIEAVVLKL